VTIQLLDGVALERPEPLLWETNALLGDAVFETMRSYGGRVLALPEHLARLGRSAEWADLVPPSWADVEHDVSVAAKAIGDGAVRAFLVRRRTRGVCRLVTAESLALEDPATASGIAVCTLAEAEHGTTESAHAKYARYLPRMLARARARQRGFDDALLVDAEGHVVSAATASVCAVIDGTLVTTSVLEGITRGLVVRLAEARGMPCAARRLSPDDVARATEMFATSSLREVVPIVRVDDRVIGAGGPGATTRTLHSALRALG